MKIVSSAHNHMSGKTTVEVDTFEVLDSGIYRKADTYTLEFDEYYEHNSEAMREAVVASLEKAGVKVEDTDAD